MTNGLYANDLVVLVADKNMEFAVKGVVGRSQSMNIQEIIPVIHVHPEKDPGCFLRGHGFLRSFMNRFAHALILFDREGCGQEGLLREALEADLEARLAQTGWGNRAAAIAMDPELEMWVWSDSPHVDTLIGWQGKEPALRPWLQDKGLLTAGQSKPERPKEALELALRVARKPRSSSLYSQLAQRVSLDRCTDPSFAKLKTVLRAWFPVAGPAEEVR